jgi:hypothetical protein
MGQRVAGILWRIEPPAVRRSSFRTKYFYRVYSKALFQGPSRTASYKVR